MNQLWTLGQGSLASSIDFKVVEILAEYEGPQILLARVNGGSAWVLQPMRMPMSADGYSAQYRLWSCLLWLVGIASHTLQS